MFNHCKLMPCGRIIFYNQPVTDTSTGGLSTDSTKAAGLFSKDEAGSDLGLSHVANSDNPQNFCWIHPVPKLIRAKRGSRGITTHGRNMVRAGCHWLEEKFGKRNLTFLTATLPDEAVHLCTPETWAEVVNRFEKSLRYHLKSMGLCPELVGCTEIQPSRLLKMEGIPPLHLHLLFQGRRPWGHWGIDKLEFRRLWQQACTSVWPISVDFGTSCRAESIYRSGVSYMSKYLSKGGAILQQCKPELLPAAWYTVSLKLKGIIKATISTCNNYLALTLFNQVWESDILTWAREIYSLAHGDGSSYLVGWVGQIRDRKTYWNIKKQIDSGISAFTENQKREYSFVF